MKRTLATILIIISTLCNAQTERHLYNIKGEPVQTSAKTLAICFDTYICHGCMNTLAAYCKDFKIANPDIEIVILIRGVPEIGTRRSLTSALRDYYMDEERPTVVYDLNPKVRKQYFNKHKIKHFPALILFSDTQRKECYLSEPKLFFEGEYSFSLSEFAINKISTYFEINETSPKK